MHIIEGKLKSILEKSGLVDEKVFQSVKDESLRSDKTMTDVLIGRGIMPEGLSGGTSGAVLRRENSGP